MEDSNLLPNNSCYNSHSPLCYTEKKEIDEKSLETIQKNGCICYSMLFKILRFSKQRINQNLYYKYWVASQNDIARNIVYKVRIPIPKHHFSPLILDQKLKTNWKLLMESDKKEVVYCDEGDDHNPIIKTNSNIQGTENTYIVGLYHIYVDSFLKFDVLSSWFSSNQKILCKFIVQCEMTIGLEKVVVYSDPFVVYSRYVVKQRRLKNQVAQSTTVIEDEDVFL